MHADHEQVVGVAPIIRILAVSGSLRAASQNTALLRAAGALAPPGVAWALYQELGALPPFNPDLEGAPPAPVLAWRARLRAADGVMIASPEYAHGVTGVLKNALDWVVASGELAGKPLALINAAPRAVLAQAALAETLTVMSAQLVAAASITLPVAGRGLDQAAMLADAGMAAALRGALAALVRAIGESRHRTVCGIA